jgi:tetratricopeptide (TPR) repeat protein
MFARNKFFKPLLSACLSKMTELERTRTSFRDKSYTSILQVHHQPIVINHIVETHHPNPTFNHFSQSHIYKNSTLIDLLRLGKSYESAGAYRESLKCFLKIISNVTKVKTSLESSQKDILIEAYLGVADIIHIRSQKDEDQAISYLDKALQLDRNNLAAFELKRAILADRNENISRNAVLASYRKSSK